MLWHKLLTHRCDYQDSRVLLLPPPPEEVIWYLLYFEENLPCLIRTDFINPSPSGQHFADGIFRCIFVNEKFCILIKISLNLFPRFHLIAWRRIGDKPLSEPMLTRFTEVYMRHWGDCLISIAHYFFFFSFCPGIYNRVAHDIYNHQSCKLTMHCFTIYLCQHI